jgi:hypothetical protein
MSVQRNSICLWFDPENRRLSDSCVSEDLAQWARAFFHLAVKKRGKVNGQDSVPGLRLSLPYPNLDQLRTLIFVFDIPTAHFSIHIDTELSEPGTQLSEQLLL